MRCIRKSISIVVFLSVIAGIVSCSTERQLAKHFTKPESRRNALLLTTDQVFKVSSRADILDSLEITDEALFDSVLYANSNFLQYIDDKKFIDNYMLGLEQELGKFGFNTFKEDQMAEFMEVDSNASVIYVAQLEIEEALFPYRDETVYYDNYFYHDHMLNSLSVYSWFEINEVNVTKDQQVYFAEEVLVDEVEGEFTLDFFGGDVKYFYTIDSLKTNEIYEFAFRLLNKYIRKNLPQGTDTYWRFDPETGSFFTATNDKFILAD